METREFLRDWEGTGWPSDDFTVSENKEDLTRLERRHQNKESFTYTVLGPASSRCVGCVYVFPTSAALFAKAEISARGSAKWSDFNAAVYFWVRKTEMEKGLDTRLLQVLDRWFEQEWNLGDYLYVTNERVQRQIALLKGAGRSVRFEVRYTTKPTRELAF